MELKANHNPSGGWLGQRESYSVELTDRAGPDTQFGAGRQGWRRKLPTDRKPSLLGLVSLWWRGRPILVLFQTRGRSEQTLTCADAEGRALTVEEGPRKHGRGRQGGACLEGLERREGMKQTDCTAACPHVYVGVCMCTLTLSLHFLDVSTEMTQKQHLSDDKQKHLSGMNIAEDLGL